MSSSSSKPPDKSSKPPAKPEKPVKASWRGKAQAGADGPRHGWQSAASKDIDPAQARKTVWFRVKITGFSLLVIALFGTFVYLLPRKNPRTPFLAVALTKYRAPVAPNAWAKEDIDGFGKLAAEAGTLEFANLSDEWPSKEQALESLEKQLQRALKTSSEAKAVVVYLSIHGVTDESGSPCLLFPQSSRFDSESWLRLREVLNRFKKLPDSINKLLILDSSRMDTNWSLGILYNTFNDRLTELVEQADVPGLVILNSSSPGEAAWPSPELKASVFGHYVLTGLAGAADQENEGGNSDRAVTLGELYRYLKHHVAQWAREHRADVQVPMLVPDRRDFTVVYARGGMLGRFDSPRTPIPKKSEKGAETDTPTIATSAQDVEIATLWQSLENLPPHVVYRVDPVGWQHFVQQLMRFERLVSAGSDYNAEADETLQKLKAASEKLKASVSLRQSHALPRSLVAHTLPLADAFGLFRETGKQRADLRTAHENADPELKPDKFSYLARAEVAWNSFLQDQRRETATNALQFAGDPESGLEPGVIEMHFLQMIEHHLERETWQEQTRELISQAVTTRDQAERVAALRIRRSDGTSAQAADERIQYWVYNRVEQGDKARRLADDGLFVGGRKQLEESRDLWRDAAKEYDEAQQVAAQVEEALRWRDQSWAELPFLATWLIRHSAEHPGASDSSDPVNDLLLPIIRNSHKLAAILDQQLDSDSPDPATFSRTLQEIRRDLKALKDLYRTDCDALTKAVDDQTTLRRIAVALAVPLLPWSEREILRNRHKRIAQGLHDSFPDTPLGSRKSRSDEQHDSKGLDRVVVRWDEHPALAMLSRENLGRSFAKRTDHERLATDAALGDKLSAVEKSGGAVRESLASLSAESSKWLESSTQKLSKLAGTKESRIETRSDRSQADRLVRAAAALLADPPEAQPEHDPIHQLRLLDLHNLLVWHCQRTLDDFWGPADPTSQFERPFFAVAAERYLEAAKDLCKTGVGSRPKQDEEFVARFEARTEAAKRWAALAADAITLGEEDDEPEMDHSVTITLDPKLPTGNAAFFLRNSGDATIPIRTLGQVGFLPRTSFPVDRSDEKPAPITLRYQLSRADLLASGSRLSAVVLYRGHQQTRDIAIDSPRGPRLEHIRPDNPKTAVTVSGQTGVRGAVMLILDCSLSMEKPTKLVAEGAAAQSRFAVAIRAFDTLLSKLEEGKHFRVGVRFFGHRVGYTGKGLETRKHPNWKSPNGKPIPNIWPGGDEELIRPIGHFTPSDHKEIGELLKTLVPWGITPVRLALRRSLTEDFTSVPKEAPKIIVVITDGINEQQSNDPARDPNLVVSRDEVEQAIRQRAGIRVFTLALEVKPEEEERARDEFENYKKLSGGGYFPANDLLALHDALEKLIPNQYAVLGTDAGQPLPKEKDWIDIDRQASVPIPPTRVGTKSKFTVQLKHADPVVKTDLALEGGESVQLYVSDDGLRLEHKLYDARKPTFSSLATAKQGLPDPSDPTRQFRVGVHTPAKQGTSVVFPISIQNADPGLFSPRPAEAWVEITPVVQGVPNPKQSYAFYDMTFEEGRPVPVLSCAAPEWPSAASAADVRIWFKMRRTEPSQRPKIREVANKQGADGGALKIAGVTGVTLSVKTKPRKNPGDDFRIIVTENHPPGDPNFNSAKVELDPPAKRTAHRFDRNANSVVHTFYVSADVPENVIMNDYELRLTSRKALEQNAIQWVPPTPIKIPGPADLTN